MITVDAIVLLLIEKTMIRSSIERTQILFSAIEQQLPPLNLHLLKESDRMQTIRSLLDVADIPCAVMIDSSGQELYSYIDQNYYPYQHLLSYAKKAIELNNWSISFSGITLGIFWKQRRDIVVSGPMTFHGRPIGGLAMVLPLSGIYQMLRQTQPILMGYLFINVIIFTIVGNRQLFTLTVKPINRLLKRAEAFTDEESIFFITDKRDNEFNQLSKALNRMVYRLAESRKELKKMVQSLEIANRDLKKAQDDIINAEKLASVGRLSAGIAHEIGNPIAIIVGYLELLKRNDSALFEKEEWIHRIEGEINRISTIIKQLLELSRPTAGDFKTVSIHELINDMVTAFQHHPLVADIRLSTDFKADSDIIYADTIQLRQVLLNLLLNAVDAINAVSTSTQGVITIETKNYCPHNLETKGEWIEIGVHDTGHGILNTHMDKIFDPFFTTKEPGKGTGLGLSVCFMIIRSLGGNIEAVSEKELGTTMKIRLPLYGGHHQ